MTINPSISCIKYIFYTSEYDQGPGTREGTFNSNEFLPISYHSPVYIPLVDAGRFHLISLDFFQLLLIYPANNEDADIH